MPARRSAARFRAPISATRPSSLVAFILRNTTIEAEHHVSDWTTLGKADTSATSWGGFVGYQHAMG